MQDVLEPPTARDLLAAWELGLSCSGAQRSVVLLEALLPQRSVDELLAMSLRARDDELLEAHRLLFGPRFACVVTCPSCGVDLELELPVDGLLAAAARDGTEVELEVDGWAVRGRPITIRDVLDAAAAPDAEAARALLLSRCVVSATSPTASSAAPVELPPDVQAALAAELERRNPTGALDIEQVCPDCGHVWTTPFDAVSYLWAEIDAWAQRTLREIDALARAYGWAESEILALSTRRRASYLEMAARD